uniref:WIT1/2 N-terminal helical bundle domain-containing protein n=2 Tax=Rhizophora mucronata TaxID=61149 RepID=A0A2P2JB21_RHIMU
MNDHSIYSTQTDKSKLENVYIHNTRETCMLESIMKVLTEVDLDLACSSEKLVNLHVLLMHLVDWDNDLEVMAMSATSIEKALEFDLLSEILDSTVRDVENFVNDIKEEVADARNQISSCRYLTEMYTTVEEKLDDTEELLKESREHVFEVKMQSSKLQRAFSAFKLETWEDEGALELSFNGQKLYPNANLRRQTAEQHKHILRRLEKSLTREINLEKNLSSLRQNEEELKLKLHYMEQVAVRMEETAEVVWARFLEAENAAEVLMGISKELAAQLQIVHFNLNGSVQREAEVNAKLQHCIQQIGAKDAGLRKLENSIAEHIAKSSEVPTLMEKLKSLEEQLKISKLDKMNVKASNEESQEQLSEMENVVESLKESIYEAEKRAETAEAKITQLTDTNVELTEEIKFLKDSRDSDTKKVSLLEKQLRDLEIQLQQAKASSEASQEQQGMLYDAIWDMETLIEDLKSKASKAESKAESAEEQCVILSESNLELNNEINFLRSKVQKLEMSWNEANNLKAANAREIDKRSGLIMDTVMQLVRERERIHNQLLSLAKENEVLAEKLRKAERDANGTVHNNECRDNENGLNLKNGSSNETCGKSF